MNDANASGGAARRTAVLAAATLGARSVGLLGSLITASALGPAAMGLWATLRSGLAYGNLSHLGALEGMRRDVPRLQGEGRVGRAAVLESTARRFTVRAASSLAALCVTLVLAIRWIAPDSMIGANWHSVVLASVTLVPIARGSYWSEHLALRRRFDVLARLRLERGVAYAVSITVGAVSLGVAGACAGLLASEVYLARRSRRASRRHDEGQVSGPGRVRRTGRNLGLRRLVGVGLPITAAWWVVLVQENVDRVLGLSLFGAEAAGHLAIGSLLASLVFLLPEAASRVLSPDLNARSARAGGRAAVEARIDRTSSMMAWCIAIGAGVAAWVVEPALRLVLPEYTPAASAARVLLLGSCVAALVPSGIDRLVATDRSRRLLVVAPVALGVRLAFGLLGGLGTGSIAGVAAGGVAANAVFVGLLEGVAPRAGSTRSLVTRFVPIGACGGVYLALTAFLPPDGSLSTALLGALAQLVVVASIALVSHRRAELQVPARSMA